jgi:TerB-C domain
MMSGIGMFRDLLIGGFLGIAVWLWQVQKRQTRSTPEQPVRNLPPSVNLEEQLALALEQRTQAETQIAELNQLATDRAIELIQLQVENAELREKIAELSQKKTRKKRPPKLEIDSPPPDTQADTDIPQNAEPTPIFALNLDLIQEKQIETTAATQLLQSVFVEEPITEAVAQPLSHGEMIGLDVAHSTFLQILSQQLHWTREDLTQQAQQADLLLDGALEIINEVAFDRCDEALTDGEDPIELNPDVLQVLLS